MFSFTVITDPLSFPIRFSKFVLSKVKNTGVLSKKWHGLFSGKSRRSQFDLLPSHSVISFRGESTFFAAFFVVLAPTMLEMEGSKGAEERGQRK